MQGRWMQLQLRWRAPLASSALKFVDVQYGSLALFDMGLEGYVGLPDVHVIRAMLREHASTEKLSASNNKGARP
jgi:hypothetical protein